jgi:UDP-galactopyranose mutase
MFLSSCAHKESSNKFRGIASLKSAEELEGIWFLQGSNDSRGPYNGELELKRSDDGTYSVTRVVNYISYYYEGLRVQEVWVGKALPSEAGLVVTYGLNAKQSVNEFFKVAAKDNLEASFQDHQNSTYKEWISTKRKLEEKSLRWIGPDFYIKNYDTLRVANRFIEKQSLSEAHAQRLQVLQNKN